MNPAHLFAQFRSQIFAMVGVVAVCGLGASTIAWLHIQRQNDQIAVKERQIGDLVATNQGWVKHAAEQNRLRALEQKNVLLLEDKLALIEQQNVSTAAQLKDLETSNAEVKEYMSRRIPADLRRLLERK